VGAEGESVEPAPRPPREKAAGAWQWARTAGTQRALLDAARAVFAEQGFADASIAEVVRRAGSSVGSLYHHFGGKSELFVALWQEYQAAQEEAASSAVAQAKRSGERDPFALFSVGARAYLEGSWERRDLVMLFFNGDSPPGFEVMQRRRGREWIVQNDTLLKLSENSFDRLYASILTSLIGEGAREVATATTRRQANKIIDAVLEYVRRLMTDGPSKPAGLAAASRRPAKAPAKTPVKTAAKAPVRAVPDSGA
jgi:AcrR family transcriptional regulator